MSAHDIQFSPVHRIDLPRIVLVGQNVLDNLGEICNELGYGRAIIVSGRTTFQVAGKRAHEVMAAKGIDSTYVFADDAQLETVNRIIEDTKTHDASVVVGVGGGRSIDVAKLAAAKTKGCFISVPTVSSHDGIASSLASIKGVERPYTMRAVSPIAVIMDSKIIAESPYRFTASGSGDIVSKITEVEDWKLSHRENGEYYGAYAGSLALMSSQLVMENAEDIHKKTDDGIRILLEALISCGVSMSIAGSSRPCSGSAHLFSHALDIIAKTPALHGEQCGVGSILMAKLHGFNWEYIRDRLKIIGAPINAKELHVTNEEVIESLVQARGVRPERFTILNKIKLDYRKAESLAKECLVI